MQEASAWNPAKISAAHRALFSACEDLDLPHAVHLRKRAHQRLNALRDAAGLGRDRHGRAAVCRNCLIDRQYICPASGKNRKYLRQTAGLVLQHELERELANARHTAKEYKKLALLKNQECVGQARLIDQLNRKIDYFESVNKCQAELLADREV